MNEKTISPDRLLRIGNKVEDIFKESLREINSAYGGNLKKALKTVHNILARDLIKELDYAHFSYRSLLLGLEWSKFDVDFNISGKMKRELRNVFSIYTSASNAESCDLFADFAREIETYEPEYEILPEVDCDFCSIALCPNGLRYKISEYLDEFIYPIDPDGINVLVKMLIEKKLFPWSLSEGDLEVMFEHFKITQGDLPERWDDLKKKEEEERVEEENGGLLYIRLPSFREVFEFAVKSSIITLNLVSDELFEKSSSYPIVPEGEKWEPGKRKGKKSKKDLEVLRKKLLSKLNTSGSILPERVLIFIPIRLTKPDRNIRETIGLVAFGSGSPISFEEVSALTVMEHVIFPICRQYEMFLLHDYYSSSLVQLELQRFFARLMAHEISKPFFRIQGLIESIQDAMEDSGKALDKFAKGIFKELEEREIDLYDIMFEIRKRYEKDRELDNVDYNDEVRRNSFVIGDFYTIEYTLGILVGNAIIHGKSYVKIWNEVKDNEENGKKYMVIYVSNGGERMLPHIEREIKQGKAPTVIQKPNGKGEYGMGLNLAFEYARLKKWKIKYHCIEKGFNTVEHIFELWLPVPDNIGG